MIRDARYVAGICLERDLKPFYRVRGVGAQKRGWLREIRQARGLLAGQVAKQRGVSERRIYVIEQAEVEGTLTLGGLRAAAAALDCDLVYAVVPRDRKLLRAESRDANLEESSRRTRFRGAGAEVAEGTKGGIKVRGIGDEGESLDGETSESSGMSDESISKLVREYKSLIQIVDWLEKRKGQTEKARRLSERNAFLERQAEEETDRERTEEMQDSWSVPENVGPRY